jgi:hypothetical protein
MPFAQVIELDLSYHLLIPAARSSERTVADFRGWLLTEATRFRRVLAALLPGKVAIHRAR